ncbi:molybdate ABC transporter substrate-binding protein [Sutterella sp.]|uniref:molybdate ABC transporter substrate-binding protein n=1 Tax=Sutterella sp. TaxID=1981025 RepID=UPI0026DF39FC|nr:molybdate ABC transporter substrate-binding protein [Sutterella sp.]MDO5531939.1 molybdate ABC transporter substrate-binding protein [Sutterella sp.]
MVKFMKTAAAAALCAMMFATAAEAAVTVTTGGGYVKMVEAIAAAYEKDTGVKVEKVFGGNIGQMLAQVESGSPVTVVISDATSLKKFTKKLNSEAGVRLGDTPLVFVWRKGIELTGPADLVKPEVKRVAMPDPKAAIYGRAAKEYLDNTGLGAKLGDRLNVVSMVPQVMSYVGRGEMDAGFVNLLAARQGKDKVGGFVAVKDGYEPIRMTAQPVKGEAGEAADVKAFLGWLASPKADKILERFGVSR